MLLVIRCELSNLNDLLLKSWIFCLLKHLVHYHRQTLLDENEVLGEKRELNRQEVLAP